jgi:serine/threonine-protein kinase
MGQVYRARDTRLERDVAVKVVSPDVAADPGHLARFNEEARATAALNHPNILAVFDVGRDGDVTYLVSEILEGRTLREVLKNETLPVSRVVDLAGQMADGLAAAHARGIVHRDLKPENVFVTTEGRAKILDFGLAKVVAPDATSISDAHTRALTAPFTVFGSIGYMSPEQVRGQPADHRSDLFAFGCVLYEMLAGRRPFEGETVHDTLSAALRDPPPPIVAMRGRPLSPALLRIVERCLEKSPAARFQSTTDLAFALRGVTASDATVSSGVVAVDGSRRLLRWRALVPWAVAAILLAALVAMMGRRETPVPPRRPVHLVISGGNQPFRTGANWEQFAIAADGSRIVYSLVPPGTRPGGVAGASGPLYSRRLDEAEAKPIPGTDGAVRPILSPDGEWLVFTDVTNSVIRRVGVNGGSPLVVTDNVVAGGTWALDGSLVMANPGGLVRVPSSGGAVAPIVSPDSTKGELAYSHPQVLANGAILLTIVRSDRQHMVAVLARGATSPKSLVPGMHPRFVAPDLLIFGRQSTLWAATFDATRLEITSEARPVMDNVLADLSGGASNFGVSNDGTLVFIPGTVFGATEPSTFAWLDRAGHNEAKLAFRPQQYGPGLLSPDGSSLLVGVQIEPRVFTLWLGDTARGTLAPVTSQRISDYCWSSDGTRVEYRTTDGTLWERPGKLSAPETRLASSQSPVQGTAAAAGAFVDLVAADGRTRVYTGQGPTGSGTDIWLVNPDDSSARPRPWLQTPSNDRALAFSPDRQWLLYATENPAAVPPNRNDFFIQPFPGPGPVISVTQEGGGLPVRWAGDEIIFRQLGGGTTTTLLSARVATRPKLAVDLPKPLLAFQSGYRWDDVTSDGQRFLFRKDDSATLERPPATELHVIVNWVDDVRRRLTEAGTKAR